MPLKLISQHHDQTQNLLTLLQRFRGFQATDPRDLVYALLGFAADVQDRIPIDYGKSVFEARRDATTIGITKSASGHQFEILSFGPAINQFLLDDEPEIELPS